MIRGALARVVIPVVCGYLVAAGFAGCGSTLGQVDPATSDKIRDCSAESRQAFYEAGKPKEEALEVYRKCIADGGVK